MLANSLGQDLEKHLVAVSKVSKAMAEHLGVLPSLVKEAEIAGLLHDIGKAIIPFQNYIKKAKTDDDEIHGSSFHHEVSWAFLIHKMNRDVHGNILSAVYWHHAQPIDKDNKFEPKGDNETILNGIDLNPVEDMFNALVTKYGISFTSSAVNQPVPIPEFFLPDGTGDNNSNAERLVVRGCVISADRCVSGLSPEEVSDIADGTHNSASLVRALISGNVGCYKTPSGYDIKRFTTQEKCAQDSYNSNKSVVQVRATAGYGKTIIGLLWGSMHGKKIIWVCPRNVVAKAVYDNILKEMSALGITCTVELYLTGKRESCNFDAKSAIPEFNSDIVVTNIDNLLAPMISNRVSERLFSIMGGVVVFDEYHEFVGEAPLFAAFITLMRVRSRLSSTARSLLLSATPTNMHILWDSSTVKTLMLPNALEHYPAAHNLPYNIEFSESLPPNLEPGSLTVLNSIKNSQKTYLGMGADYLVHSKYTDQDRKIIMSTITSEFGPKGTGVVKGRTVISAPVIQAAMDISFKDLTDSVISPEASLQRIGRCDRWGTLRNGKTPLIRFMNLMDPNGKNEDKSEAAVIKTIYSSIPRQLWLFFLRSNLNGVKSITLDELYKLYNRFYIQNGSAIINFLKKCYKTGLSDLQDYYPTKVICRKNNGKKTGSRSLRSPDGSYFITVKTSKGSWLTPQEAMSEGKMDLWNRYTGGNSGAFAYKLNKLRTMEVIIKKLIGLGYTKYQVVLNKKRIPKNLQAWLKLAKDPETPLPDVSRVYDTKGGQTQDKIGLGLREI